MRFDFYGNVHLFFDFTIINLPFFGNGENEQGDVNKKMIKPHGAETLTPLYVSDDAQRAELTKEAEQLPSVTDFLQVPPHQPLCLRQGTLHHSRAI